jgi:predicted nucleic acid-binding protein
MKAYWDASALIESSLDAGVRAKLHQEGAFTRTHSLAETFATLSGNPKFRTSANDAARAVQAIANFLEFVDLSPQEVIEALKKAESKGVRGGRVHDYIHALAAQKSGAKKLLTLDKNDFNGLVPGLAIEQV